MNAQHQGPLPVPQRIVVVQGGDVDDVQASRIAKTLSGFAPASTVTVTPEADIDALNLQPDEAVVCSPFDGATFAYLQQIEGLRIYGPAVCDQGLPLDRRQIYAPTLSNPMGAPLAVHVVADTCEGGVVHEGIVNRLSWMGAMVVEDPAAADLFLANTHNHHTKAARRAGKPVVRTMWVEMCWQQFLDSKGTMVEGDRDYRLGALVGARIAFCLVGVSDRIRKSLLDCAQQCGAEVMPKIAEGCTHFICTYAGRTHDFELATRLGAKTVGSKWLLSSRSRDRWMEEDEFLIREDAQPQATEALNVTDTSMMVSSPAAGAAVAKAAVATPESASGKTKPMRNSSLSTSVTAANLNSSLSQAVVEATMSTPSPTARQRAATADPANLLLMRKRKHDMVQSAGASESTTEDELSSIAEVATLTESVARASPSSSRAPTSDLFHRGLSEEGRNVERDLKRKRRAEEMLKCEKNLASMLEAVHRRFVQPLRANGILDLATLNAIFAGFKKIQKLSEHVGEDLLAKLSGWETGKTELADVFTEERMLEYKGAYKHVVNNTDRSRATLEHELKTNRAFAAFVSREEKAPELERQRLIDVLNLPMQHIMRYSLHLKEIIKNTPPGHSDGAKLTAVLERFVEILKVTNRDKDTCEKLEEVAELRANIEGLPAEVISGASSLLKCMENAMELKDDGHYHRRELILFSDQLVVTSYRHKTMMGTLSKAGAVRNVGRAYKYRSHWPLENCVAVETDLELTIHVYDNTNNSVRLKFESEERMRSFLAEMRDAIRSIRGSLPVEMHEEEKGLEFWMRDEAMHRAQPPDTPMRDSMMDIDNDTFVSPSRHPVLGANGGPNELGTESRRESLLQKIWRHTTRRSSKSASKMFSRIRRTAGRPAAAAAVPFTPVPPLLLDTNGLGNCTTLQTPCKETAAASSDSVRRSHRSFSLRSVKKEN